MPPLIRPLRFRRYVMPILILWLVLSFLALRSFISRLELLPTTQSSTNTTTTTTATATKTTTTTVTKMLMTTATTTTKAVRTSTTPTTSKSVELSNQTQSVVTTPFPLPQVAPPEVPGTRLTLEEITGGEPSDATVAAIRDQIREMTKHAWDSYVKHAWGANELKPISQTGHQPSVLGTVPMGLTIVDAMDTLYIMGLETEFEAARDYVSTQLNFDVSSQMSVFESTIRYLGGLLTAYTFTLDKVFLNKAVELAQHLLPAFDTPTGIPMSLINLKSRQRRMFSWSRRNCAILSEAGTLHMEFTYLSELTGDPVYAQKVNQIRQVIKSIPRPVGLYFNYVGYQEPQWCGKAAGLGGLGDSFYEYLLKEWIRTDHMDTEGRKLYDGALQAFLQNGLFKRSAGGHLFVGSYNDGVVGDVMEHLACFAGGMLALGAENHQDPWFERGVELADTCNYSYAITPTKLGPEMFEFTPGVEAMPVKAAHKSHLQRPEAIETFFYLWRLTKNETYRAAALSVVQSLEKHSRTSSGYAGLKNSQSVIPKHDDVQQSYFLAETLKYLYLIFSEDSLLPLDRWVFNSEGHPFPIHNKVSLGPNIWPKPYEVVQSP